MVLAVRHQWNRRISVGAFTRTVWLRLLQAHLLPFHKRSHRSLSPHKTRDPPMPELMKARLLVLHLAVADVLLKVSIGLHLPPKAWADSSKALCFAETKV